MALCVMSCVHRTITAHTQKPLQTLGITADDFASTLIPTTEAGCAPIIYKLQVAEAMRASMRVQS
jgi:hypothetical protein